MSSKAEIKTYGEIYKAHLQLLSKPGVSVFITLDTQDDPAILEVVSLLDGEYTSKEIFEGGLFIFEDEWDAGVFFKKIAQVKSTHIHAKLYNSAGVTLRVCGY